MKTAMKSVLQALIVTTAFAAGSAFAEANIGTDETWLVGPRQSAPALFGASKSAPAPSAASTPAMDKHAAVHKTTAHEFLIDEPFSPGA